MRLRKRVVVRAAMWLAAADVGLGAENVDRPVLRRVPAAYPEVLLESHEHSAGAGL